MYMYMHMYMYMYIVTLITSCIDDITYDEKYMLGC